ncbi:hypothetical protein CAEBREN_10893 [Caenorhabditis brenneri]|uniref:F-box domain-containing protein n=1 Tax=Caenorhabditis brenneri TaxID=135651 RepID=G0N081_CAEBE|nr:hypothetical protein CAEBREN_10893 [Caenorhabditis brenneri]
MAPEMLDLPDVILWNVLKKCDFFTIHKLRRVCNPIRNFIIEKKPDASFSMITVIATADNVIVKYYKTELMEIQYRAHPRGTLITYKNKEIFLKRVKFSDVFLKDFQAIMQHQKSKLTTFSLRTKNTEISDELLKSRGNMNKLQVDNLEISLQDPSDIQLFLSYIKPDSLTSIRIYNMNIGEVESLEMSEIIMMDHWKQAKEVYLARQLRSISLENFSHFHRGFVKLESVNADDLTLLKQKFLNSPNFKQFCIEFKTLVTEQDFFDAMGEAFTLYTQMKWFFGAEDRTRHLAVVYDAPNRQISFAETEFDDVPFDAIVSYG